MLKVNNTYYVSDTQEYIVLCTDCAKHFYSIQIDNTMELDPFHTTYCDLCNNPYTPRIAEDMDTMNKFSIGDKLDNTISNKVVYSVHS